jgi:hypothetical protein
MPGGVWRQGCWTIPSTAQNYLTLTGCDHVLINHVFAELQQQGQQKLQVFSKNKPVGQQRRLFFGIMRSNL